MDLFKLLRFERDRNTSKKHPRDDADKLTLGATGLLAQLSTYGSGDNITASISTWAELFGTTRVTIRKYRDELIAKGFLVDKTPERSDRVEHAYKLTNPADAKEERPVKRRRTTTINPRTHAAQIEQEARQVVDRELARAEAEHLGVYLWEGEHAQMLAQDLKVPFSAIGATFWEWMDDLKITESESPVITEALEVTLKNADPQKRIGYFRTTMADKLSTHRGVAEIRAAA